MGKKLICIVGAICFMLVTAGYDHLDYRIISFDEILEYDEQELSLEEDMRIREMASDETYIRDADEFSSQKAYYKYLEYRGDVDFLSEGYEKYESLDNVFGVSGLSRTAATNVSATLRVTLNGITSPSTAIQAFYIGTNYLYTTQMGVLDNDGKKDDVIFRRFSLNSDGTVATYLDKMNLRNFGHCQTLDYYMWHGVSYFLMSCHYTTTNYVDNNGNPYYWATEICRVHYSPGTTLDYSSCKRLTNINKANEDGTSFGTVKRVDGALSSNKEDLVIWCRNTNNVMQFSIYWFEDINDKWDEISGNELSCDNVDVKDACFSSEYPTSSSVFAQTESSSVQGLELNDADCTYIANGSNNANMYIIKLSYYCNLMKTIKISNTSLLAGNHREIEGLQLKGDYVYFGVCNHNVQNNGVQYIYSVPKNSF